MNEKAKLEILKAAETMTLDNWVTKKLDQLRTIYQEFDEYMEQKCQEPRVILDDQCLLAMAIDAKIKDLQILMENNKRGR